MSTKQTAKSVQRQWEYGPEDADKVAKRLLRSSAEKWYDPEVDLDWDKEADPDKLYRPEHHISLYGTYLWDRMTPEQRKELGRQEIAQVTSMGIFAEVGLMQGLLKTAMRSDPRSRQMHYALAEVADECRHSMMFARSLEQGGMEPYLLPQQLRNIFSNLTSLIPAGPFSFFGALMVEELLDRMQRATMHDESLQPHIRMINRIHVTEEARHIAFARDEMRRGIPSAGPVRLALYRFFAGLLAYSFARTSIDPRVYKAVGLDPEEARKVALANPHFHEHIRWMAEKFVAFQDEVGMIGWPGMWLWRRSHMLPAAR